MRIVKDGTNYILADGNMPITRATSKTACQNMIENEDLYRKNAKQDGYIRKLIEGCNQKCSDILFAMIDEFKYDDVVNGESMKKMLAKVFPEVYKVEFSYSHDPYYVNRPARYKVHVAGFGFFGTISIVLRRPEENDQEDFWTSCENTIRMYKNCVA